MNHRGFRRDCGYVAGAIAALGLALSGAALAQPAPPQQAHGDLFGIWYTRGYERRIKPADGSETPWLAWSKESFDKRGAAERNGYPMFDPTAACMPSGVPRIVASPYPLEIIPTADSVWLLYEAQHLFRQVRLGGAHPKTLAPSFMGDSVGHWDGDTLVVDTVGLTDETQIDEAGTLHSDALHVVETYRRLEDKSLEVMITIDDPKTFAKPWTARRRLDRRAGIRMVEYVCEENNRNAPDAQGVLKHF